MSRTAVRAVANAIRPVINSWRRFWDVDHRSVNFMTPEEYQVFCEQMEAKRLAMEKEAAFNVARYTLRKKLDEVEKEVAEEDRQQQQPSEQSPPRPAAHGAADASASAEGATSAREGSSKAEQEGEGGAEQDRPRLGGVNATSFHIIVGGACAVPTIIYFLMCAYADARVDKKGLAEARMANRMVLDKRLEAIEELLSASGGTAVAPSTGTIADTAPADSKDNKSSSRSLPGRVWDGLFGYSGSEAVYDAFFNKSGIGAELDRRKEAMVKGQAERRAQLQAQPPIDAPSSTAPAVPAPTPAPAPEWVSRLEERLATIERALSLQQQHQPSQQPQAPPAPPSPPTEPKPEPGPGQTTLAAVAAPPSSPEAPAVEQPPVPANPAVTAHDTSTLTEAPLAPPASSPSPVATPTLSASASSSSSLLELLRSVDRMVAETADATAGHAAATSAGAIPKAASGEGRCPMGYA